MQEDHFFQALDSGVVEQLLPLGDSIIGALVTLATAAITYGIGKARSKAEVENLQAEKKNIEAATGVTTADAAKVISEAAAATVQPLIERIKEQRSEITEYRDECDNLRTQNARLLAENELMRTKFKLQGETPPELPSQNG